MKYRDGVTKAVWQYKSDLENRTLDMPVPAIWKLLAFQWLMKHTEHYDAKLMGQQNFLMYMTKFLTTERKIASRKGDKQRLLECDELYK